MSIGRLPSGAILGNGPYCESSTNSGSGTCGRVIEPVSLSGMGRGETSGGGGGASSAACCMLGSAGGAAPCWSVSSGGAAPSGAAGGGTGTSGAVWFESGSLDNRRLW